ncbi:MAG: hypothetical protein ACP5R5_09680 [Armatimonadota bacterium]
MRTCVVDRSVRAVFLCLLVMVPVRTGAASFPIPDAGPAPTLAALAEGYTAESNVSIDAGCSAGGRNNIDCLWRVTDYGRPARSFGDDAACARIDVAQW